MRRRWRFGLRTRTTAAFALSGLLVSLLLSILTYQLARQSFTRQRRDTLISRATERARTAQEVLQEPGIDPKDVVDQLGTGLLVVDEQSFPSPSGAIGREEDIPAALRAMVQSGRAGRQLIQTKEGSALLMGFPLSSDGKAYYELASLGELERSLRDLGRVLALAATATTLGGAVIGRIASGQVIRPLRRVADAATGIAGGRLDTRLDATGDPDLQRLVRSFNDMATSLQGRIEREARFASDVSHELRNPLTTLSTAAQLLHSRRDELSERSQTALDVLVTQTGHFERLVLDLLEISRFDAGAAELHRESQDVVDLVHQIVAGSATPEVPVDAEGLRHRVLGVDKRRIDRMLANLLQNALLYGGGATRVTVAELASGAGVSRLQLAVEDRGVGIPDDEKATVFERFTRGKANSGRGGTGPKGTGLGLSLVAEHARLHGGAVHVEDVPGGGARFVVDIEALLS